MPLADAHSEQLTLPLTFTPFAAVPPMTLRLFGVRFEDRLTRTNKHNNWEPFKRYQLFRKGIAEILDMTDWRREGTVTWVTRLLLNPPADSPLFELDPGHGLTYYGEIVDTAAAHEEVQNIRRATTQKLALHVLLAVTEGDIPESWQKLHDQTAQSHRQVRSDV